MTMRSMTATGLIITGAAAALLTGCSSSNSPSPDASSSSPTSSASESSEESPVSQDQAEKSDRYGKFGQGTQAPGSAASPTSPGISGWSDDDRDAAKDFARKALDAFAATDKPKKAWLQGIAPYMTQDALMEWQDAEPSKFPIKGPITATPELKTHDTNPYIASARVNVNGTTWIVELQRDDQNEWKATQIGPENSPIDKH